MARVLSDLQREINAELTALGGEAFTEIKYRTNADAMTLLSMKDGSYKFASTNLLDQQAEYEQFLRLVSQTKDAFFVKDIKEAAARVFGLQYKPLINEIADVAYMFTGMTHSCPTCGQTHEADDIQGKIDTWVEYCSMVQEYIKFIKKTFPNWNKMKSKEKDGVLNYWKLLENAPFSQGQAPFLSLFFDFVDNYDLHQGKEAKAKALLALNLPRITTIEIARDVTTYSSLNK